nr:hypothetical protein [Burkholderia anthina]
MMLFVRLWNEYAPAPVRVRNRRKLRIRSGGQRASQVQEVLRCAGDLRGSECEARSIGGGVVARFLERVHAKNRVAQANLIGHRPVVRDVRRVAGADRRENEAEHTGHNGFAHDDLLIRVVQFVYRFPAGPKQSATLG